MIELLFALSLLVNAGLIGYLYSVRKQNSTPETKSENVKESVQENVQECVSEVAQEATEQLLATTNTTSGTADISFFKTEKDKLFFLLNEVDGKRRNQLLGITADMYSDERLSKQWFKHMSSKVHPDKNPNDPRAAVAFDNLKKLYSLMTL
ncbi:DnaJ domain-containing protein [Vibrio parahaemolyticus]|nr:DnaJ domain-containing protein [Vibrio parahaemolyticus]EJG1022982.1 DnaJ domain-containing protein [Vibrio parahaemolyticus]ELA9445905.1 DnaJ domain-containing protein [Vibrio parahaemolyticus]